jgi:hypothetical protein
MLAGMDDVDALIPHLRIEWVSGLNGTRIAPGFHKLPIVSVGEPAEFLDVIAQFNEDVWNLAGVDIRQIGLPIFDSSSTVGAG